jgi:delta-aminolevulinic acid dehydratase/porphobilinogen synthase
MPNDVPSDRPRRTRRTAALRAFVRETEPARCATLIHPLFIAEGTGHQEAD